MLIQKTQQKPTFKSRFYNVTRELDASVPLSRAVVDLVGCDIPWVLMANNKEEKKEKARKLSAVFVIAWLSPFLTLPLSNRFAMKYVGKLTNKFWSNNHKAIHLSNECLKNSDDMMKGLAKISKKTTSGPLEALYNKISKPKYKQEIDIDALLKSCGGDKELLRKKLITSKNAVLFSDLIFSIGSIGTFVFINNEITAKNSGQIGFSAEIKMADKEIIEKRAKDYQKNKLKHYSEFMGLLFLTTLGLSLASYGSLISKNNGKIVSYLKNRAKSVDYNKGIYMSRTALLIGSMVSQTGYLLACRNKTERKDTFTRYSLSDAVFFGGDLLMASLLYNASDKLLKTKLTNNSENDKSLFRKIFPKVKSIKTVMEEVKSGKIQPKNKIIAATVFWMNLGLIALSMGYIIPKFVNKMIKKDVQKDVNNNTQTVNNSFVKADIHEFLDKKRTR